MRIVQSAMPLFRATALSLALLPAALGPAAPLSAHELPVPDPRVQIDEDWGQDKPPRPTLPYLEALELKILDLPGTKEKLYCVSIRNYGLQDAGPFQTVFSIDGIGAKERTADAGHLKAGESGELCSQFGLPGAGTYLIGAHVDAYGTVHEASKFNNYASQKVTITIADEVTAPRPTTNAPANDPAPPPIWVVPGAEIHQQGQPAQTDPSPTPKTDPSPAPQAARQAQPDLTIGAVKVNGQAPDGKDDCKDGKNRVTIVVKNAGTANAESVVVRLVVGGDQVGDETIGLEAGQEREVRFDDVRLRKGEQKLAVTVDPKGAVAESDEANNERQVTVRCQADN
jgi:hypothetical protein